MFKNQNLNVSVPPFLGYTHPTLFEDKEDPECAICLEKIQDKLPETKRLYGILENCDHRFCWECINEWRESRNAKAKDCPICGKYSKFMAPSKTWITGGSTGGNEKKQLLENFIKPQNETQHHQEDYFSADDSALNENFINDDAYYGGDDSYDMDEDSYEVEDDDEYYDEVGVDDSEEFDESGVEKFDNETDYSEVQDDYNGDYLNEEEEAQIDQYHPEIDQFQPQIDHYQVQADDYAEYYQQEADYYQEGPYYYDEHEVDYNDEEIYDY